MTANELWNVLSCHGPGEQVQIDETGLRVGSKGHIEIPVSKELKDLVFRAHWSDGLAGDYLRTEL